VEPDFKGQCCRRKSLAVRCPSWHLRQPLDEFDDVAIRIGDEAGPTVSGVDIGRLQHDRTAGLLDHTVEGRVNVIDGQSEVIDPSRLDRIIRVGVVFELNLRAAVRADLVVANSIMGEFPVVIQPYHALVEIDRRVEITDPDRRMDDIHVLGAAGSSPYILFLRAAV